MGELHYVRVARGEVCTQGAQVLLWRDGGGRDVLFVSKQARRKPGKPIRGGIPVVFPWFGEDPQGKGKAHGVVRREEWRLDAAASDPAQGRVVFGLEADADTRADWPHEFRSRLSAELGAELRIEWLVENTGREPFRFEQSLHTYLLVGDVRQIAIRGLQGATYLDGGQGGARCVQREEPLRLVGETERFYVGTTARCVLDDPVLGRRIAIDKQGSASTLVWHPWQEKAKGMSDFDADEWTRMVCIEQANVRDDAIVLAPGAVHRLAVTMAAGDLPR